MGRGNLPVAFSGDWSLHSVIKVKGRIPERLYKKKGWNEYDVILYFKKNNFSLSRHLVAAYIQINKNV